MGMEPTEASPAGAGRPRPWLVIALVVVAGLALVSWLWPVNPATPVRRPSNAARPSAAPSPDVSIDPDDLDVRLEALSEPRGGNEGGDRNPFRFKPKPPPPPPPAPVAPARPVNPVPEAPVGPPPPPPIGNTVKFIGIVEPRPGEKVAAFSDCRITTHAREGEVVFGQYRLVRIGVESVVMEYLDGRGRTTIRLSGEECIKR
jgi:type IV secretory pathway VirB10-like protein